REEKVDELVKSAQEGHIMRLKKGLCNPLAAAIFTDLLNNLERVSDHSVNIVEWVESYSVENSR
ncbi:MAG: Na/Pi cotransporter family protein, partial [Candidatus Woesearchaeota archaeon]|nr:Na/Pi cotransporter family protein [Candidatus Woesearchaeota archaeon]